MKTHWYIKRRHFCFGIGAIELNAQAGFFTIQWKCWITAITIAPINYLQQEGDEVKCAHEFERAHL